MSVPYEIPAIPVCARDLGFGITRLKKGGKVPSAGSELGLGIRGVPRMADGGIIRDGNSFSGNFPSTATSAPAATPVAAPAAATPTAPSTPTAAPAAPEWQAQADRQRSAMSGIVDAQRRIDGLAPAPTPAAAGPATTATPGAAKMPGTAAAASVPSAASPAGGIASPAASTAPTASSSMPSTTYSGVIRSGNTFSDGAAPPLSIGKMQETDANFNAAQGVFDRASPMMGLHMSDGGPVGGVHRKNMKHGGPVRGPGTPTSDSVPIAASRDEYVLPADTVRAVGVENLDALKDATHTPTGQPTLGVHRKSGSRGAETRFGIGGVRMADGGSTTAAPALPQNDPNSMSLVGNRPAPSPFWVNEAIKQVDSAPMPVNPRADMTHSAASPSTPAPAAPFVGGINAPVQSSADQNANPAEDARNNRSFGTVQTMEKQATQYPGGITGTGNVQPVGAPYAPGELNAAMLKAQNGEGNTRSFNDSEVDAINKGIRARGGANSFSNVDSGSAQGFGISVPSQGQSAPAQDLLVAEKIAGMNRTAELQRQVNNLRAGFGAEEPTGPTFRSNAGIPTMMDDLNAKAEAARHPPKLIERMAQAKLAQEARLAQQAQEFQGGIHAADRAQQIQLAQFQQQGQFGIHRADRASAERIAAAQNEAHLGVAGIHSSTARKTSIPVQPHIQTISDPNNPNGYLHVPVGGGMWERSEQTGKMEFTPTPGQSMPQPSASPHPDGTQLKGKDGKMYVVKNGQPVPM